MIPDNIKELIKIETYPPYNTNLGGQSVGTIHTGCKLTCEGSGFEVIIDNYRSQIKNRELALTLFELYLQEIKII
jgi:protein subunit release factor A